MRLRRRNPLGTVVMSALASCCAAAAAAQTVVLELANLAPGGGTIESSEPAASCASVCSFTIATGMTVTLTANPTPGYRTDGWGGDCAGSGASCTLVMDGRRLALAGFKPAGGPLTVIHRFLHGESEGTAPLNGPLIVTGGYLYGMTWGGGRGDHGTIFRQRPDGSEHLVLHDFLGAPFDGSEPWAGLIAYGGVLYGMTSKGGASGGGTVFKMNLDGGGYTVLHSFGGDRNDGGVPHGSLLRFGGALYGMTGAGGGGGCPCFFLTCAGVPDGCGTVFKINLDGSGYTILHIFTDSDNGGIGPSGSLIESGGALYGTTVAGGDRYRGAIFRIDPVGGGFAQLHSFGGGLSDGAAPFGSLLAFDGILYGTTAGGGTADAGAIFRINPDGSGFALLHSFAGGTAEGAYPEGSLTASGTMLYGMTAGGGVGGFGTIFAIGLDGSGFATLHSFALEASDGATPAGGSLVSYLGALLGTTSEGGASFGGTVFSVRTDGGGFTLLHSFSPGPSDLVGGWPPNGTLVAYGAMLYGTTSTAVFRMGLDGGGPEVLHTFSAADCGEFGYSLAENAGTLYGMTVAGSSSCGGSVFRINPDGSGYAVVHTFNPVTDGRTPAGPLVTLDGALYGMMASGGANDGGRIFRVNPDGSGYGFLHAFVGGASDGERPQGPLTATGGMLFGTTWLGGAADGGTIFRINPDGSGFTLLHAFSGGASDGGSPTGPLTYVGGVLYGMTALGGTAEDGTIFRINPDGSGFALLHSFSGDASDGAVTSNFGASFPPLLASGDVLYGVTPFGGGANYGTIFRIKTDGTGFTLLYSFSEAAVSRPISSLVRVGGSLFGASRDNGAMFGGTIFRFGLPQPRLRHHMARD